MKQETPEEFRWRDWDWRPLARLVGWVYIAVLLAHARHVAVLAHLGQVLTTLILLSILSFGVLSHIFLLAAMGALRLAMAFDDAAYALAERIIRPFLGRAPFAATFFAAFGAEVGLVFGAGEVLLVIHAGERLSAALWGVLR
ncbi:MAG: hypothetical protein KGL74_01500 [Elusimicrobia bacterium]|nr:hypothetical protein [Elusimicrobiota bacterium]